jgi:MFS family permease
MGVFPLGYKFLTGNVLVLSIVSMLADISTEMIQPILPLFLVGTLGASYAVVGLIEGSSDTISSLVKVMAGSLSDKFGKRKQFVIVGYLPTAILKPLLYLANSPLQVLAIRIPERLGKGVRGPPRDALIAESVDREHLGKAFGFHRAFDTLGAVIGSFLGFVLLILLAGNSSDPYRLIFALSAIPAIVSVIIGQKFVKEVKPTKATRATDSRKIGLFAGLKSFDSRLKSFILISSIFAFANFNLSFFILGAKSNGMADNQVVLLYTLFNITYAAVSYPFGVLADRIGRDKVVMIGYGIFVVTTLSFASSLSSSLLNMVILFGLLGVYMGVFDGSQKAYISEISSPRFKATALGTLAALTGLITLPSSFVAGILWDKFSSVATFEFAAVVGLIALVCFHVHILRFRKNK